MPIIAIYDIWKTTRVSVLSYISLPVHILYDNPNIFFKLMKFVSFWHQDHEHSKKEMLTKRSLTGSTPSSSLEPFRSSPKVSLPAEPSSSSSRSRVSSLSPSSSAELSLESHRSVLSALMSEESPDKLERSLSLSAKTAASTWSASMTKHYDRCLEERWCERPCRLPNLCTQAPRKIKSNQPFFFLLPRKLEHSCSRSNPVNQQMHSQQTRSWRWRRIRRVRRIQVCMARKGLKLAHIHCLKTSSLPTSMSCRVHNELSLPFLLWSCRLFHVYAIFTQETACDLEVLLGWWADQAHTFTNEVHQLIKIKLSLVSQPSRQNFKI